MLETTSDRISQRGGAHFGSPDKLPVGPHRRDRARRAPADPVHERHPDRHRRDPARARRGPARAARPAARARAPAGDHRPELPRQGRHEDGRRRRADARRPPLDDRRRAARAAARGLGAGASEPLGRRVPRAAASRHRRLRRRLARHARPREPRGALARRRAARVGLRRRRPDAAPAPRRSTREFLADPETWLSDGDARAVARRLRRPRARAARALDDRHRARAAARLARRHGARSRVGGVSPAFARALERAETRALLDEDDATALLSARGPEIELLAAAADRRRVERAGDRVTYVVCRNVNYTNVCYFKCGFCAFSKGKLAENLRGPAYLLSVDEVARRAVEAWSRGATEVCLQGGIHPGFSGRWYLELLRAVKEAVPGDPRARVLAARGLAGRGDRGVGARRLPRRSSKEAGLGSLPGTAAEILDDDVRRILCPDKVSTAQWLEVMRTAHGVGLRSTATMMFGHIENPRNQARHLLGVRDLQRETGGFTEFVPLPFVADEAPIALRGRARSGPTFEEVVVVHAASRLILDPVDRPHPGLVGQARPRGRARAARRRRRRPRRHADERVDQPRRRRGARPGVPARGDGGGDPSRPGAGPRSARRCTPMRRPTGSPRPSARPSSSRRPRRRTTTRGLERPRRLIRPGLVGVS